MLVLNADSPVSSRISKPHLIWTRPARRPRHMALATPERWSRYERLSFSMLGVTWGILILAVSALHVGNYQLDTRTSSTSGSHSGFYESARALKLETPPPPHPAPEGSLP